MIHKLSLWSISYTELVRNAKEEQFASIETPKEAKMLYQDKALGGSGFAKWLAAWFVAMNRRRRVADLDLLSMNTHLRRDLGIEYVSPRRFSDGEIYRK